MTKLDKSLRAAGVMRVLIVGQSCFQKKERSAERAGKQIDKAIKKAGQQIEKAGEKIEDEQMQIETLSEIAILGENWAEVMEKNQDGYFVHEFQGAANSAAGGNPSGFSAPSEQGEWGRCEDEDASPFSLQSGESKTNVGEAYPCPR